MSSTGVCVEVCYLHFACLVLITVNTVGFCVCVYLGGGRGGGDTVKKLINGKCREFDNHACMHVYANEDPLPNIQLLCCDLKLIQIISDVISFLVGRFYNSGYMMTWLLWYMAINPDSQQRLLDEVKKEVGGDCGD